MANMIVACIVMASVIIAGSSHCKLCLRRLLLRRHTSRTCSPCCRWQRCDRGRRHVGTQCRRALGPSIAAFPRARRGGQAAAEVEDRSGAPSNETRTVSSAHGPTGHRRGPSRSAATARGPDVAAQPASRDPFGRRGFPKRPVAARWPARSSPIHSPTTSCWSGCRNRSRMPDGGRTCFLGWPRRCQRCDRGCRYEGTQRHRVLRPIIAACPRAHRGGQAVTEVEDRFGVEPDEDPFCHVPIVTCCQCREPPSRLADTGARGLRTMPTRTPSRA